MNKKINIKGICFLLIIIGLIYFSIVLLNSVINPIEVKYSEFDVDNFLPRDSIELANKINYVLTLEDYYGNKTDYKDFNSYLDLYTSELEAKAQMTTKNHDLADDRNYLDYSGGVRRLIYYNILKLNISIKKERKCINIRLRLPISGIYEIKDTNGSLLEKGLVKDEISLDSTKQYRNLVFTFFSDAPMSHDLIDEIYLVYENIDTQQEKIIKIVNN